MKVFNEKGGVSLSIGVDSIDDVDDVDITSVADLDVLQYDDATSAWINVDEATFKANFNLEIGVDVQAYDAELLAIAGLTSAADKLPYFTGSGTASLANFTAFARSMLDDASEAVFKATVNLEIGTDVLAYDAGLSNLAGVAMAANKFYYTSADNVHVAGAITAFGRSLIDDAAATNARTTLGLVIGTNVLAQQTIGIADDNLLEVDGSPSSGQYARFTANGLEGVDNVITLTFIIDGGGSEIATGIHGYLEIPFACTITRVTTLADQSGSIVVDIWKCNYSDFDVSTHPVDGDSITASAPLTISSAVKAQDSTLTGWTTAITAGDILAFNVDSITTCERVTISIRCTKT